MSESQKKKVKIESLAEAANLLLAGRPLKEAKILSKSFPKKSSTKKRALPNATTDEAVKLTRDEKKRLLERHHNNLRDKSAPVEGLAFEQQLRRVAIAGVVELYNTLRKYQNSSKDKATKQRTK